MLAGTICPFIDTADTRCESRLSLGHLSDAFDRCICNHHGCPVYRQMKYEQFAQAKPGKLLTACAN
jgi:hypothetical protein